MVVSYYLHFINVLDIGQRRASLVAKRDKRISTSWSPSPRVLVDVV